MTIRCLAAIAAAALVVFASAARCDEVETLFPSPNAIPWETGRDDTRLHTELSLSELHPLPHNGGVEWRFISRNVTFNDIFLQQPISRPFRSIRVRLTNTGAPFTLAAKVSDADRAEWTVTPVQIATGETRVIEMPASDWKPASWSRDADGQLDFPLASFALIAFDVKPGSEYSVRIERIDVVRANRPMARVTRLELPGRVQHGMPARLRAAFRLEAPCTVSGTYLVLQRGGGDIVRLPVPITGGDLNAAGLRSISANLQIPEFIAGGASKVALEIGDARVTYAAGAAQRIRQLVAVDGRKPRESVAVVKAWRGSPALFIDGKANSAMTYTAYGPSVNVFRDFARAGINLYSFCATPTEAGYGLSKTAWKSPDVYDFSELDQRAMMVLQANPNARFFPRLYLHAPVWWAKAHPNDVVLYDPGDGKPVPFIHAGGRPAPSWASDAWRRDTVEGLRRLIRHVEASPWADRCIGYHLASGTTEEWMMWGGNEDQWVDYSPVNVTRFRKWLRTRYKSVDALRHAWGNDTVTFVNAAVPSRKQRADQGTSSLRYDPTDQAIVDYQLYNANLVADTITYFAHEVKQMTGHKKIVGAFYGYLLQLCGEQRQQNSGHLALEKVLNSPDIDFLCSPTSYAFRQLGGAGTTHFMSLAGSVRLHGKLWFDENDVRTSLSGGQIGEWGRPANVDGDLIQQDKELAHVIVQGAGQWWFDVGGNRYDDPRLMERIGHLAKVAQSAIQRSRQPADEVAFVIDEDSLLRLRVADPLGAELPLQQLPALHRLGAPVGHYLASDLTKLSERKLIILPTSFAPDARQLAAIDGLKGGGRVLVFLWAPGAVRGASLSEDAMQAMTGIRLRFASGPQALNVTPKAGSPLTAGVTKAYGTGRAVSPAVYADDPDAEVDGLLPDGSAGLVVKRFPGWTAVFSAAPLLPARLLRNIAQMAGVHEYITTDDVVWASRDMVAVCVEKPGVRTIQLPRRVTVRDLYTSEVLAHNVTEVDADFGAGATRLFGLE